MRQLKIFFIYTCLTLIGSKYSYAQSRLDQLQGDWIKYKIDMKDGSKLYSNQINDSTYFRFSFKKNSLSLSTNPVKSFITTKLNFNLSRNSIIIPNSIDYDIEKISRDTLIIIENSNDTPDKQKRFYLVNQKAIIKKMTSLSNKTYKANSFLSPTLKEDIDMTNINKKSYNISGTLRINLTTHEINVTIDSKDTDDKHIIKKITRNLEKSYKNWNLDLFKQFQFVEIPFFAKGTEYGDVTRKINNKTFRNLLRMPTLDFVIEKSTGKQITMEELSLSTKAYKEGVEAFKNGNYEKAIEYFEQSYKYNKYNLEALYSKAAVNYQLGNIEKTCEILKILSDLGQVRAHMQMEKYCNVK